MGIFGGKPKNSATTRAEPSRTPTPAAAGLSIIGVGMTVRGDLESNGVVKVEGTVDGNVRAKAQVLIAKGGVVHGDIETAEAVVGGTVMGSIRSENRVEVQAGAAVEGDIATVRISVAEGGSLNGIIRMNEHRPARGDRPAEAGAEDHPKPQISLRPSAPVAPITVPPHPTPPHPAT